MDHWVSSQRRTTKPRCPVSESPKFPRCRGQEAGFSESAGFPRCWGARFTACTISLVGSTGSPAGVTGERNFPPARVAGSGFFPLREAGFSESSSLSKKLWIAGEGRRSPQSGIPPPGSPESGIFAEAGFSELAGFSSMLGSGIRRLRRSPPGSPGSGIFDRVPRRGYRGAEFSPAEVAGSGFFPRRGQVRGVKGHSILHCTPWLAGILRSVDSICWQGADLEAVAFSCTGRRLARAANGLGFRETPRV